MERKLTALMGLTLGAGVAGLLAGSWWWAFVALAIGLGCRMVLPLMEWAIYALEVERDFQTTSANGIDAADWCSPEIQRAQPGKFAGELTEGAAPRSRKTSGIAMVLSE